MAYKKLDRPSTSFLLIILGLTVLFSMVGCGGGGGGVVGGSSAPPPNPVPSIASVSPSSVTAGAAAQTLTVTGTSFLSSSTVTYNNVAHTATFVSSTELTISLSASDQATAGVYAVIVTNPSPGGGASNSLNFTVNNSVENSAGIPPAFFGMSVGLYQSGAPYADKWPTVTIGTMAKTDGTQWSTIEQTPGNYTWTSLDGAVNLALANGVNQIIYTFYGVPSFYNSFGSAACLSTGCPGPPSDLGAFNNFVTALVTRYKGEITYYELWNEGNRQGSWNGTTAQFVSLAQSAYQIIKSIDPNAKVLSPSPDIAPTFESFVQGYLEAGGTAYADGVAFHGYQCQDADGDTCLAGTGCDENGVDCAGAPLVSVIQDVRQAATAAGAAALPLYDTEGGWRQNKDLPNLSDQIAYISRWYVIQASEGIASASWFTWDGAVADPDDWGTIFDATTGQATLAATSYQVTHNWLSGSAMNGVCAASSSNVWTCPLTFSNGNKGLVVWNGNEISASYTPASEYIQYEDLAGDPPAPIAAGGTVTIGEAPILLETGNRP